MTELAGGELCLPQRPHNQVGVARKRDCIPLEWSNITKYGVPKACENVINIAYLWLGEISLKYQVEIRRKRYAY